MPAKDAAADTEFSLATVEEFLRDRVAPLANTLDHDVTALHQAFRELGAQSWLGLKIPTLWGGRGLDASQFQAFQELLTRYSGALAFLQAQHQSAGSLLSRCQQFALKQQYLPQMSTGAIAIGVGFSHLRRSPSPVTATTVDGGFCLNGTIPWITGFGMFHAFIGAAALPDHRAVYGLLPLTPADGLHFSPPLAMAAMSATQTVTATLQDWFLPSDQVLWITPPRAIDESDRQNVLQHSFYALGCARAGLDQVQHSPKFATDPQVQATVDALDRALTGCRQAIYAAHTSADSESFETRLQLRATAIHLAVQCAHAAVLVAAGAANAVDHPAQRIYREALVFSVTGQTPAILHASLAQLRQTLSPSHAAVTDI